MINKTISAFAVIALSASLAMAAPGQGKHGKAGKFGKGGHAAKAERFAEKLNLSEAQRQQMRDLRQTFRTENQPLRDAIKQARTDFQAAKTAGDTARAEAVGGNIESLRAQMKDRRAAQHERMLQILTAEQRAQLESMKSQRGGHHQRR